MTNMTLAPSMAKKKKQDAASVRERLGRIAKNLWWSWQPDAVAMWNRVSQQVAKPKRESLRRNPVALVAALNDRALTNLVDDPDFRRLWTRVERSFSAEMRRAQSWPGLSAAAPVAYFSMEFGLHESLPIYAGGLGLLAGDHVKSASDLGVPLIGVGLFYRRGYFRQQVSAKGKQEVIYPSVNYADMAMEPVLEPGSNKKEIRIEVDLEDEVITLRAWRVQAGRVSVYLLDSDIPENRPALRSVTHRLYGGTREDRIRQEVVAGIGGVRLLRRLGIEPGVWHLNEGHVVFLTLERLKRLIREDGLSYDQAVERVAADTVFTTHTPVPEGNEVFDLALADRYLRSYAESAGVSLEKYFGMGLDTMKDGGRVLSLTVLALRLSRFRNGVSALHGEVSRGMWSKLWPGFSGAEVPIGSVTNGVHVPTWVAPEFGAMFDEHLGEDWRDHLADGEYWKAARRLPARKVWSAKNQLRAKLVVFVRRRVAERLRRNGASEAKIRRETENLLDPGALTFGFARRFALYKRAALLFRDIERAAKIMGSKNKPVQIIFAGKPHPEDPDGAKLLEKIESISRKAQFRGRVVLLENYDIEVARHMVQGVDVWLNNPRRPLEASGTSGQKVPVNAGLNCSIPDGWWCEGEGADTGFSFGKTKEYTNLALQDKEDADALYRVLERELVPLFYRRNKQGLPADWLKLVKSSMAKLVPQFSTHTMVTNYANGLYAPARERGREAAASKAKLCTQLSEWRERIQDAWPLVHVRSIENVGKKTAGKLSVNMYLAGISPNDLLCCDETGKLFPVIGAKNSPDGSCQIQVAAKGATGKLRLFPAHVDLVHPQELGLSLPLESR